MSELRKGYQKYRRERIKKRIVDGDGTLGHKCDSVRPAIVGLKKAVPMLEGSLMSGLSDHKSGSWRTMLVLRSMVSFVSWSMTFRLNSSP
jgi:hypothetical protein